MRGIARPAIGRACYKPWYKPIENVFCQLKVVGLKSILAQVGVALRCGDALMTEQFLNPSQAHAGDGEPACVRVAEGMRCDPLRRLQAHLDKLARERKILESTTSRCVVTYDPAKFAVWARTLKNNFLSMYFETRRELVRKFVGRIEVRADRSAEMTWDPEVILQLVDGARVPATATMVMKELCGV